MPNKKAEQAKQALEAKTPTSQQPSESDYLSTGVTLLNLGLHGRTNGGILKGGCYRLNGRSSGGKTFVCRTILAEAAANPAFDGYELVYDDVEHGALMDTEKFFGAKLVKRLKPPAWYKTSKRPYYSRTVMEFYTRLRKRMEEGKRVIWIEDSLDALESGNDTKMTDNKAKMHSQELRKLMDPLAGTGSILILVSQARANMNKGPFDPEDIVAGGRALEHYPNADIQLRKSKSLRKPFKGVKYVVGSVIRAQIAKNRISGRNHTIFFPFFPSYGIDDLGANVDYLLFVKHWKKGVGGKDEGPIEYEDGDDEDETGGREKPVIAPEFGFQGTKGELIAKIEEEDLEKELQVLVGKVWRGVEEACTPVRKARYV